MKTKRLKIVIAVLLLSVVSCDDPVTVVTDIVHPDGSITRRLEMKSAAKDFETSNIQVPFDSTWIVRDSIEINDGDTIWVKRAEKLFSNTEELNATYAADSSSNREFKRKVTFAKSFRWFSTEYRFSEIVEKITDGGYPVSDYLSADELMWFYSPDELKDARRNSSDSLKMRALDDSVSKKSDSWLYHNVAAFWISEFTKLTQGRGGPDISYDSLKAREKIFVFLAANPEIDMDSSWNQGIIQEKFLGKENAEKFRSEADSALNYVMDDLLPDFDNYTMKIIMPGKLISSTGFADSTGLLLWPVKSDFFLTSDYEMKVESRIINYWALIITGVFLLFVISGLIYRRAGK